MTGKWRVNSTVDSISFSTDTSGLWRTKENGFKGKEKGWSGAQSFIIRQISGKLYIILTEGEPIEINSLDNKKFVLFYPSNKQYLTWTKKR